MIKYFDLRKKNYADRKKRNDLFEFDIYNWKSTPYSCLKARVYIELSTIFAFLTQFTSLTANHISLIYCICGLVAGTFLASNIDSLMITGLIIFFLKGSVDWTDGLVARIKNQTSPTGHILDTWGSHIGSVSLISSLGIYCYNNFFDEIYLILTIIILFLKNIDFKLFAYHQLFYELLNNEIEFNKNLDKNKNEISKKENLAVLIVKNFMDDRARTVDMICFLILLEIIYDFHFFSKIILTLYLLKAIILFIGIFYAYYYKGRIDKNIQ